MDFRNEMKKLEGFSPEDAEEMEFLSSDTDNMLNLLFENGGIEGWNRLGEHLVITVNEELSWETVSFEDKKDAIRQTHAFVLGLYTFMMNMAFQTEKEIERRRIAAEEEAKRPKILIPTAPSKKLIL